MKRTLVSAFAAVATLATLASNAFAGSADSYPTEITKRPLTLPGSVFQINANGTIDLSKGSSNSLELSPNIAYGVSDELELSLTHQGHGSLFFGPKGSDVYSGFGADVTYWALKTPLGIAPHAGVDVGAFDPKFGFGINAGTRVWYNFSDSLVLNLDPRVGLNVANRNSYLNIPVNLLIQTNEHFGVRVESGFNKTFNGGSYAIPLGVAGVYAINHNVDLGARFTFTGLINGYNANGLDGRTLGVFANFRL